MTDEALVLSSESIAHSLFRNDVFRLSGICFDLASQAGDEHTQILILLQIQREPHFAKQEAMRENFTENAQPL